MAGVDPIKPVPASAVVYRTLHRVQPSRKEMDTTSKIGILCIFEPYLVEPG